MKNKILFTGASGFSGKSLTNYLDKKKFNVKKIVFKSSKNNKKTKIDLTKKIRLKENFNWIIHAAAHLKIKDFEKNPKQKAKRNPKICVIFSITFPPYHFL